MVKCKDCVALDEEGICRMHPPNVIQPWAIAQAQDGPGVVLGIARTTGKPLPVQPTTIWPRVRPDIDGCMEGYARDLPALLPFNPREA
jgi:hypothetical protein